MNAHYLNDLLRELQLNAKQFAESIGLARPDKIYHVLNGRNGISSDLASQICDRYPSTNYDWLLTGKGDMLKGRHVQQIGDMDVRENRGFVFAGQMHGGQNNFHNAEGKDQVIRKQEEQVLHMFEAFMEELRGFHKITENRDEYTKRQDDDIKQLVNRLDEMVKHSYLRNERNMQRMDKDRERLDRLIAQQNQLIQIIDRRDQKMFELWEKCKVEKP